MFELSAVDMILSLLSIWVIFFIFHRLLHRYSQQNKKWPQDLVITLLQSLLVFFIIIPLIHYFQ
ncbi:hypothetical protein J27TS8_43990 [Robertmurraya siralis]|uniref:Uncharacterized protein n=1 Tax=Robertmurraya siralis TaxID=77777 RepID=A0A919WLP3_9BACI|nr:hypothetical protein [Robertmurraya siralis]GIN64406.1 hypothetical protein J27TS8_43990 [Robertmurraya siralis]